MDEKDLRIKELEDMLFDLRQYVVALEEKVDIFILQQK